MGLNPASPSGAPTLNVVVAIYRGKFRCGCVADTANRIGVADVTSRCPGFLTRKMLPDILAGYFRHIFAATM
jgi:hypothetical protein